MMNAIEGDVIVYRSEEMTKVLIHELIHFYDFDRKHIGSNVERELNMYFNLTGKTITVNESFTDTFACLINTVIYSIFQYPLIIDAKQFVAKFMINYEKEKAFITSQAANVLKHQGYNITQRGKIIKTTANHEKTHVISYYVLKAANFNNIERFIDFLHRYNYHLDNPIEYIELLKANIKILADILYIFKNANHLNSLRMTSLDIDLFHKVKLLKDKTKK
jgi:hypothetical protein